MVGTRRIALGVVIGCMVLVPALGWAMPVKAAAPGDAQLQRVAARMVVKMDALAPRHWTLPKVYGSDPDLYIKALKHIIHVYVERHPHSGIRMAAALSGTGAGHTVLSTNDSAHLDWMASEFIYGPSTFTTLHQVFGPKTETYRIFNLPLSIPRPYRTDRYRGALAVYRISR